MSSSISLKKSAMCSLTAVMFAASQGIFADTRLQIPVIPENTQVFNNLFIIHGCDNPATPGIQSAPVFGESVIFPDGVDSTITENGAPSKHVLTDFVVNWGNLNQKIQSNDVFPLEAEKIDTLGNVYGWWGGNGQLPGTYFGLNPFVTGAVPIVPTSCAKSVTFKLVVADVCKMTNLSGFNTETVNVWTPVVNGSNYNGTPDTNDGYDSPATLTVTRNLTANPLPGSCGAGVDVVVTPSASQINSDMPVFINGKQEWPLLQ